MIWMLQLRNSWKEYLWRKYPFELEDEVQDHFDVTFLDVSYAK